LDGAPGELAGDAHFVDEGERLNMFQTFLFGFARSRIHRAKHPHFEIDTGVDHTAVPSVVSAVAEISICMGESLAGGVCGWLLEPPVAAGPCREARKARRWEFGMASGAARWNSDEKRLLKA
jgi:hypothetical protein